MHRLSIFILLGWILGGAANPLVVHAQAQDTNQPLKEFEMTSGDVLKGEIAAANEDGLVVRLIVGGFSERVAWAKFTQPTLQQLAKLPQTQKFAEPFVDVPLELKPKKTAPKKPFTPKPVSRVELPPEKSEFMSVVMAPANLVILLVVFIANLYAAFEIAGFRGRPVPLVCGLSVVLPVIGPLIFLALPSRHELGGEAGHEATGAEAGAEAAPAHGGAAGGLAMAKGGKAAPAALQSATYTRGDTTFDRRFFEVKFAGFFRVVLSDAEKEFVIVIKTVRNEYVARRIARITAHEMHVQLLRTGATDVSIPFGEITQVQLKHKDAK